MSKDELGHLLFDRRLETLPTLFKEMLRNPVSKSDALLTDHIITSGLGSSEAHAKFATYLINEYTSSTAEFIPTSYFYKRAPTRFKKNTLLVFSQGPSANANIILEQSPHFAHTVLFTANTNFNSKFVQTTVLFPPPDEFEILVRTQGPLLGYLSVIQFINAHWQNSLSKCPESELKGIFQKEEFPQSLLTEIAKGVTLLTTTPSSFYSSNLTSKFTETLFISPSETYDLFSFAHGPFQELINNPRPVIVLSDSLDEKIKQSLKQLLTQIHSVHWFIESKVPAPWDIFHYEMQLNYFLSIAVKEFKINLRDWTGKGLDKAMYEINSPQTKQ